MSGSWKKKALLALIGTLAGAAVLVYSTRQQAVTTPAAVSAKTGVAAPRSQEQARAAVLALPEVKAWSAHIEKGSGGKSSGLLIDDDKDQPRTIIGAKSYWAFSFFHSGVEGGAMNRWESFMVASSGDEILVYDMLDDKPLTLARWRSEKRPMDYIKKE